MRKDIDIDQLMAETWLTVTMLKKGAVTLNGAALYNKCVKQVESVREALERAGYQTLLRRADTVLKYDVLVSKELLVMPFSSRAS